AGTYSTYSGNVTATTPIPAFTSIDVNSQPTGTTTAITNGSAYDVTGGGADIGGSNADGFRYVYTQVVGDFDAKVQITSLSQLQSGTRAGLMVRAGLDAGAQMVFSGATASDGYRFNYRTTADAVGTYLKFGSVSYPNVWVRLTRVGDVFTGYYSTDGVTWAQTSSLTLSLPSTLDLGMAVCSHVNGQSATAQFRNLAIESSSTTPVTQPPGGNSGGTPPGTIPGLTPAQQVAADRAGLKLAQLDRTQRIHSQQKTLAADTRSYNQALHTLHVATAKAKRSHSTVDPTLQADVERLLGAVQA